VSRLRSCSRQLSLPPGGQLIWVDEKGKILEHRAPARSVNKISSRILKEMVEESFRWGEAYYRWIDSERLAVSLPLCLNQELAGGVILELPVEDQTDLDAVSTLAATLQARLADNNWINEALMRERAAEARRERLRAEAIHTGKTDATIELRKIYWHLEPDLFMAMRRGDRQEARRLLNQVLMGIYSYGFEDMTRKKGFILDLLIAIKVSGRLKGQGPLQ